MKVLRMPVLALAAALGAGSAAAVAVTAEVCADTISGVVNGETITGELLFEEYATSSTFLAVWWPGWPLVTIETAVGAYLLSDGTLVHMACTTLQPGLPD